MELKITKEKVLEAASKCSTAKATLETLFPECFGIEYDSKKVEALRIHINHGSALSLDDYSKIHGHDSNEKAKFIYRLFKDFLK